MAKLKTGKAQIIVIMVSCFLSGWTANSLRTDRPPQLPPALTFFEMKEKRGVKLVYEGNCFYNSFTPGAALDQWYDSEGNPVSRYGFSGADHDLTDIYIEIEARRKGQQLIRAASLAD